MRYGVFVAMLALLTACGVDGAPVPPSEAQPKPGVTISGSVSVGMEGTL